MGIQKKKLGKRILNNEFLPSAEESDLEMAQRLSRIFSGRPRRERKRVERFVPHSKPLKCVKRIEEPEKKTPKKKPERKQPIQRRKATKKKVEKRTRVVSKKDQQQPKPVKKKTKAVDKKKKVKTSTKEKH